MAVFNESAVHEHFRDLAALRSFARRLISTWDREARKPFRMKSEYAGATGPMIWSLSNHTVELLRTILDLSEKDRMIVALPLIRLAMEDAMTCAWMTVSDEAARSLVHEGLRQRKQAVASVVALGTKGFDESKLKEVADELDALEGFQTGPGRNIQQRMESMHDGASMYVTYRIASSLSHAGMTLADQYLTEIPATPTAPSGLALIPEQRVAAHEAWLGTAISMLLLAMKATNSISTDGRFRSQIERALKRWGVSMEIRLAD